MKPLVRRAAHVIDTHAHTGSWPFRLDIDGIEANLALNARWGIDVQMVSHSIAVQYDATLGNARLADELAPRPAGMLGYLVANARNIAAAERDCDAYLQPGSPFVGVKIHTQYPKTPIASAHMRDLFTMLNERSAIILIHTWGGDVVDLGRLVEANPNLRVIAGHMGADRWDLAATVASDVGRLYLEPSCSVTDAGQMRHVLDYAPRGQLLFGTDASLLDPVVAFGQVAAADPSQDELDDIMWRNAVDLFGDALLGEGWEARCAASRQNVGLPRD